MIGVDQHARSPASSASSRKSAHNGSVSMSSTITCSRRKAAVPHEPTDEPISTPWIASL